MARILVSFQCKAEVAQGLLAEKVFSFLPVFYFFPAQLLTVQKSRPDVALAGAEWVLAPRGRPNNSAENLILTARRLGAASPSPCLVGKLGLDRSIVDAEAAPSRLPERDRSRAVARPRHGA